jgi:hypothetical protein
VQFYYGKDLTLVNKKADGKAKCEEVRRIGIRNGRSVVQMQLH